MDTITCKLIFHCIKDHYPFITNKVQDYIKFPLKKVDMSIGLYAHGYISVRLLNELELDNTHYVGKCKIRDGKYIRGCYFK